MLPLITENIWQGLTGGRSVHLEDWPDAATFPADANLVASMDAVRDALEDAVEVARASRIELATGVMILPQRQTVLAAQQAADADLLSHERLRIGVGTGWNWVEYEALGAGLLASTPKEWLRHARALADPATQHSRGFAGVVPGGRAALSGS